MVEALLHFAVPFATLRATGVDWRKTFFASMIALTPDLDVLFHVHRSLSHSLIVLAVVALPIVALTYRRRPVFELALLGSLGVFTHLVLDVFGTYTPLLWPVFNQSVWVSASAQIHIGSIPLITVSLKILTEPLSFTSFQSMDAPLITTEGMGISAVLLIPSLSLQILKRLSFTRQKQSGTRQQHDSGP